MNYQPYNQNTDATPCAKAPAGEAKFWVAFSRLEKIGPVRFKKLIDYFPSMETAWQANLVELINAGFEESIADKIIIERSNINPDAEWEKLCREEINICLITDKEYPTLLKNIFDPPAILYYQGSLNLFNQYCLAVVGTRKFSAYGKQVTENIVGDLARNHISIISGLALGIDGIAHQACLDNGGFTAAVLGSGVDWPGVYPASNKNLAKNIVERGGCLLSEYPVGTESLKFHFPLRNRIISGLSQAVVIIEAKESSGTLITAQYAIDQNRDIFAVPGSIFSPNSSGTNNLIKRGAKLTTCAHDILEELNIGELEQKSNNTTIKPETPEEKIIIDILSHESLHIDKIAQASKLRINALGAILTMMELKGMIKDMGGKNYTKNF